jgi:hypothetical protein
VAQGRELERPGRMLAILCFADIAVVAVVLAVALLLAP